jgi:predicted metal-binding membrane protein
MSVEPSPLEQLLRHDRQIVLGVLVSVTVIAWIYTLSGAGMAMNAFETTSMSGAGVSLDGMGGPTSSSGYIFVLLVMWWMMMVAMMLPSAIPVILLTAALNRRSTSDQPPYGAAAYFTIGYLLAWFIFSVVAVAGHWVMESKGLLSPIMHSTNNYLSVGLLLAAGVWQFSPIKQACLRHCRSPVEFITHHRRRGNRGALLMGLHHGTYCLGCCWFLMLLLFVGGVMNFYWIAGLALFVVIEKLVSRGAWFSRITGAGLVIAGVALLVL